MAFLASRVAFLRETCGFQAFACFAGGPTSAKHATGKDSDFVSWALGSESVSFGAKGVWRETASPMPRVFLILDNFF